MQSRGHLESALSRRGGGRSRPGPARRPGGTAAGPRASRDGVVTAAFVTAAVALALRAVYLIQGAANPFWRNLGLDTATYHEWARAVLAGQGLGGPPFPQAPFFPLALSAVYALVGSDPMRALWVQLVPGTAAVFLTALAAGRWKGTSAAWAAGGLLALYKPAIFYTGVLLPPVWVLALAALSVWAVPAAARRISVLETSRASAAQRGRRLLKGRCLRPRRRQHRPYWRASPWGSWFWPNQ